MYYHENDVSGICMASFENENKMEERNLVASSSNESKKSAPTPRIKNRPLTESFMYKALVGTIRYLKEVEKSRFSQTEWMRNMGLAATSSAGYMRGTSGKTVPVFEEMIHSAAKVNPRFIPLFFRNVFEDLFPGIKAVEAVDTVLLTAHRQSETIDADKLAQVLEENLSLRDRLTIARKLLHTVNHEVHEKPSKYLLESNFSHEKV